jgi:kynurenine formamidase
MSYKQASVRLNARSTQLEGRNRVPDRAPETWLLKTMRIRSFIIAYALVLAILLFADRRPKPAQQAGYSHVVDLTDEQNTKAPAEQKDVRNAGAHNSAVSDQSQTRIVAPDALIPGTWTAGQIPAERLIAPLVVMDLNADSQISLDEIAAWETQYGPVPQGAVVAIRQGAIRTQTSVFPINAGAAQFLMDARYTTGFAIETPADFGSDRTLARELALHGNYVVEGAWRLNTLPTTGSLIIVAPGKNKNGGRTPVRVLAMVR